MKKLNIGCGRRYLPGWENIDFMPAGTDVKRWDLRKPLPYPNASFDFVYTSHLIEHLKPEEARSLLMECRRVLKPGGIVRVVVPDLETLAREYLESVEACRRTEGGVPKTEDLQPSTGNLEPAISHERHEWTVIFLIDQLCRTYGGGRMLAKLAEYKGGVPDFVREKLGDEWQESVLGKAGSGGLGTPEDTEGTETLWMRVRIGLRWRWRALGERVDALMKRYAPRIAEWIERQRVARYLAQGERHQWMYDEVSMGRLLSDCGFVGVKRLAGDTTLSAFSDEIKQLDRTREGGAYQPASLYMEGCRGR